MPTPEPEPDRAAGTPGAGPIEAPAGSNEEAVESTPDRPTQPAEVVGPPAPTESDRGETKGPAKDATAPAEAPKQAQPDPAPPSPAVPAGSPAAGDGPGEKSDRQSTPSSLKETIDVVPGRPAAAQGLEIKTVRPRWSDTTRLTAAPRNPIIRVTFGRNGKVSAAGFVSGQNTGWKDVDEPLLDAIYRWTAKGEALRALPATRDAGLTVQFRVMLR